MICSHRYVTKSPLHTMIARSSKHFTPGFSLSSELPNLASSVSSAVLLVVEFHNSITRRPVQHTLSLSHSLLLKSQSLACHRNCNRHSCHCEARSLACRIIGALCPCEINRFLSSVKPYSRTLDDVIFRRSLYSATPIADLAAAGFRDNGCYRRPRKTFAMETQLKELKGLRNGTPDLLNVKSTSTVGGGVSDTFGEDAATEDQTLTPWARTVASGSELLRDPRYNKGLAFTEEERDRHYLRGLLPPTIISQELQVERVLQNVRSYKNPLEKYIALMDLQERNERLFYKVLIDHVEELLPIVYTPVVGEACQKYGNIFRRPRGLYISLKDRGHVLDLLKNWPERNVEVIVVTDGERILGLGDLGLNGMGIPVGKLALYTALGGIRPSSTLPVAIDVGTNNEGLLKDPFYIGLRQKRTTGKEYDDLLDEFMMACKQAYGERVLVQFEDFANHNAFRLLQKYATTHLVFNDDIQGTAAVVLSGLVAALPIIGGTLADHKFLFLGAGEAGTGIAEIIALEVSRQGKMTVEEARKAIHLVDSKGLVSKSRYESLQEHKRPYAHDHPPAHGLLSAVKALKPTVLIGTSGKGGTFTKEVLEEICSYQDKPIIMALSNPTSQSECTAEEAYKYTKGKCVFASGSPFGPVTYEGKTYVIGQSNNCYIFPGIGLGCAISGAVRVHDDMFLAAAEALAKQIDEEHLAKNQLYPAFCEIREISAHIGAAVAAKAYELGLATRLPKPNDLFAYAKSCMYSPSYRKYR